MSSDVVREPRVEGRPYFTKEKLEWLRDGTWELWVPFLVSYAQIPRANVPLYGKLAVDPDAQQYMGLVAYRIASYNVTRNQFAHAVDLLMTFQPRKGGWYEATVGQYREKIILRRDDLNFFIAVIISRFHKLLDYQHVTSEKEIVDVIHEFLHRPEDEGGDRDVRKKRRDLKSFGKRIISRPERDRRARHGPHRGDDDYDSDLDEYGEGDVADFLARVQQSGDDQDTVSSFLSRTPQENIARFFHLGLRAIPAMWVGLPLHDIDEMDRLMFDRWRRGNLYTPSTTPLTAVLATVMRTEMALSVFDVEMAVYVTAYTAWMYDQTHKATTLAYPAYQTPDYQRVWDRFEWSSYDAYRFPDRFVEDDVSVFVDASAARYMDGGFYGIEEARYYGFITYDEFLFKFRQLCDIVSAYDLRRVFAAWIERLETDAERMGDRLRDVRRSTYAWNKIAHARKQWEIARDSLAARGVEPGLPVWPAALTVPPGFVQDHSVRYDQAEEARKATGVYPADARWFQALGEVHVPYNLLRPGEQRVPTPAELDSMPLQSLKGVQPRLDAIKAETDAREVEAGVRAPPKHEIQAKLRRERFARFIGTRAQFVESERRREEEWLGDVQPLDADPDAAPSDERLAAMGEITTGRMIEGLYRLYSNCAWAGAARFADTLWFCSMAVYLASYGVSPADAKRIYNTIRYDGDVNDEQTRRAINLFLAAFVSVERGDAFLSDRDARDARRRRDELPRLKDRMTPDEFLRANPSTLVGVVEAGRWRKVFPRHVIAGLDVLDSRAQVRELRAQRHEFPLRWQAKNAPPGDSLKAIAYETVLFADPENAVKLCIRDGFIADSPAGLVQRLVRMRLRGNAPGRVLVRGSASLERDPEATRRALRQLVDAMGWSELEEFRRECYRVGPGDDVDADVYAMLGDIFAEHTLDDMYRLGIKKRPTPPARDWQSVPKGYKKRSAVLAEMAERARREQEQEQKQEEDEA